jgi:EAL domain-containing protein (putative c-di-GMP-specific phosphodiesterase class I)
LIRAVVDIARGLEKKTIGEIIGDEETVRALTRLGVDYGQGYHLGRPGPRTRYSLPPRRGTAPGRRLSAGWALSLGADDLG